MPLRDASPSYFLLLMLGLLFGLHIKSASAIKCYVCAPVPELEQTCNSVTDRDVENCEPHHDACHVLFIQHTSGHTEILRNCGKFKGAFQGAVGANECKNIQMANRQSTRLCNCQTDKCNEQVVSETITSLAPVLLVPSVRPATDTNKQLPQPTASDTTPISAASSPLIIPPVTFSAFFVLFLLRVIF